MVTKRSGTKKVARPRQSDTTSLKLHVAYVMRFRAEMLASAGVLASAFPKAISDAARRRERDALARLLRLLRIGRERELMHLLALKAAEQARVDLQALVEGMDADGALLALRPALTIVGNPPEATEDDPLSGLVERTLSQRALAITAAEAVAENARRARHDRTKRSTDAQRAVRARLESDPKTAKKAEVFELWRMWRQDPSRHPSKARFAQAMLAKFDDVLENPEVIEGWATSWADDDGVTFNYRTHAWEALDLSKRRRLKAR